MFRPVIIGFPLITTIFAIIAYFVYGNSVDAALAVFLLDSLWTLVMFVAVIPFIGIFIYYYLIQWIFNWVHDLTGLTWTWVIDVMQIINLGIAGFIYGIVTFIVIASLIGLKRECHITETGEKVCKWVFKR